MRFATTVALVGVLSIGTFAAAQAGAAAPGSGQGTEAVAAAKKCKKIKSKSKRKKCQRGSRVDLNNTVLNRTYIDPFTKITLNESYHFCAGGLFRWFRLLQDNEGNSETTTYRGTWRLISSNPPLNAVVGFVYTAATSMDGTGQPLEPRPGQPFRTLTFAPGGVVYVDSDQFFRAAGAAC